MAEHICSVTADMSYFLGAMGEGRCDGKGELCGEGSPARHGPARSRLRLMGCIKGLESRGGGMERLLGEEQK